MSSDPAADLESPGHAPEDDVEMGFFDHLGELRSRIIKALYGLFPGVILGWILREELLSALVMPYSQAWRNLGMEGTPRLVFLNPVDPLIAYLKIAVILGLLMGAPWVFWQLWAFIAPGLYRKERRLALPFVLVSTCFFLGGTAFGYFVVFPLAFEYLLDLAGELPGGLGLEATIAINEILTLEMRMLLAFGIAFELPVVLTFLAAAEIVTWRQLLAFSRWWVLVAAILSALLTPPDVASQLLMLGPLVVLYFLSVLFAYLIQRRKGRGR
jgi:sec-independent protein translocase protein TatC